MQFIGCPKPGQKFPEAQARATPFIKLGSSSAKDTEASQSLIWLLGNNTLAFEDKFPVQKCCHAQARQGIKRQTSAEPGLSDGLLTVHLFDFSST